MPQATATVNGQVIARAESWENVEGNVYFPPSSIEKTLLTKTSLETACPWKGLASYYDINVDGNEYKNAVWSYLQPKDKATHIKDHLAFDKRQVQVTVA